MIKDELRKELIKKRSELDKEKKDAASREICDKIGNLPYFISSKNILIYISMKNEVDLKYLYETYGKIKKFYCPVCTTKENMTYVRLESYENLVESTRFKGLYEPKLAKMVENTVERLDLVIVPGVAFDMHKNRLGYGAGYYDRFFAKLSYKPIKLGTCYSFQLIGDIPSFENDVSMDYIITENKLF